MTRDKRLLPTFRKAAKDYAASDKSDPFSYNRAMSHMLNGVGIDKGQPVYSKTSRP